jgi:hypothetical protein
MTDNTISLIKTNFATSKLFNIATLGSQIKSTTTLTNRGKTVKYNTFEPPTLEDFDQTDLEERTISFRKDLFMAKGKTTPKPVIMHYTTSCSLLKNLSLHINQDLRNYVQLARMSNCSEGLELSTGSTVNKIRKSNTVTKNLFKLKPSKNSEIILLDPFSKTNLYPIKMDIPKNQKKLTRRIQLAGNNKPIMTMNTAEFFAQRRLVTQKSPENPFKKRPPPFIIHKPPSISRHIMLRPKFDQFDKSKLIYKTKAVRLQNKDNFFRDDFQAHHRLAGLSWKDKVNYMHQVFEKAPTTSKPMVKIDNVLARPPPPSQPRLLRDRVDSIRNYLVTAKAKPSTSYHFFPPPDDESDDFHDTDLSAFSALRSNWLEVKSSPPATTVRKRRRTRQRKTIFFLSPTVPYNRYF